MLGAATRNEKRARIEPKEHAPPRSGGGGGKKVTRRRPNQVPPINFERFRRNKEREHQGAPVYDTRSARSGVLESLRRGATPCGEDSWPTSVPEASRPSSGRPSTRQSARLREAQVKLQEAQEDLELEEDDGNLCSVAQQAQLKQEYWQEYNEAGSAKKTLSEFEEWQRVLHQAAEVSTTASELEEVSKSVEESEWRVSHLGFTRRSEQEEYMSDYYRQCRERHYIPLGPRGTREGEHGPMVDLVAVDGALSFAGWSLGSARLEMLCQAAAVEQCKRCDLSGNRIEDRSMKILCDKLLPRAEALNLSENLIGQRGIQSFEVSLRKIAMSPLLELNLQANHLGMPNVDAHERDLCNFVEALSTRTPQLRALNLAQNGLGRVNHELGLALGSMVMQLKFLRVLDLHWNSFHGLGAYKIFEGIYENGSGGAQLSRVDLSWNRMGLPSGKSNPSKMLADVLATNPKLFHLDISYNAIGREDCLMIADGLRYNHSLFGFHVAGNEAFVDELGFLLPLSDACRLRRAAIDVGAVRPKAWTAEEAAAQVFGRPVQRPSFPVAEGSKTISFQGKLRPQKTTTRLVHGRRKYPVQTQKSRMFDAPEVPWEEWEESAYSIPLAQSFQRSNLEEVALRTEKCWICDRYQPVKITWTPSISGQQTEDEVFFVHAYSSSDDFHQPTVLKRVKPENQAARFVGYRMVPRQQAVLVIFRVNGHVAAANDLAIRLLSSAVTVPALKDEDLSLKLEGEAASLALANVPRELLDCQWANELCQERPVGLIITEDAVQEGNLEVYPRTLEKKAEAVEFEPWDKSQSVFASWRETKEGFYEKMLKMDLKFCRIQKFAPDEDVGRLQRALLPWYPKFVAIYRKMCCWSDKHQVFGVSLQQLHSLLRRGRVFDRHMQTDHLPSMAYAAQVVDRKFTEVVKVVSDTHLIRYQVLEALLRVAEAKYIRSGKAASLREAIPLLCGMLDSEMAPIYEEELRFQESLFTEEVDYVLKNNLNLLNAAYNIYAGITDVPDSVPYAPEQLRGKRKVTLPDFHELLDDCDAYDQRLLRAHVPRAFCLASQYEVDEVSECSHMSLNFVEFLAGLGAVVFRKESYCPEEFADLLEELLLDQIKPVVLDYRSREGSKDDLEGILTHKQLKQVCMRIFQAADEDDDQTLTAIEFGNALRDPRTKELFKGKDFKVSEILNAFGALDEDSSGRLSVSEVVHGIGALLKVEQNEPRVRAFLKKELNEDGQGRFTAKQLLAFLNKRSTQRKLMRVGIEMQELSELVLRCVEIPTTTSSFERLQQSLRTMFSDQSNSAQRSKAIDGFNEIMSELGMASRRFGAMDFMEEVMGLRKPKPIPRWKILVREIFEKADVDKCGTLTHEEFTSALDQPATKARLESLNLDPELVEEIFEIIDVDGSDDVTEAELIFGIEVMLELQKGSELDLEELRRRLSRRAPAEESED